jgi:tetratricopeptide (TPR) repeat protein
MLERPTSAEKVSVGLLVMLWLMLATPARAHNGPPFPIIENRTVGPCIVALWTHPDVGTGAFYVFVEAAPGGTVPDDLKIEIGVQPVSGRLPETFYKAERINSHGQAQYNAQAEFDRQELWRVRLVLQSSQGGGEATAQVEVTPPGFGRWDLLFYLLPFLLVAFLWLRGISRTRRSRNAQMRRGSGKCRTDCGQGGSHRLTLGSLMLLLMKAGFRMWIDSLPCGRRAFALGDARSVHFRRVASLLLLGSLVVGFLGCNSRPRLPEKGSKKYTDVVSAFYIGLAALQVGDDVHAESKLSEVTQLVPTEPAGWANWGVLALRQRNYDLAAQRLERARALAPRNDQIYDLLGIVEGDRGRSAEAILDLRKAAELNPKNLRAAYALAEEIERQGDANSAAEFQQVMQKILATQPDNLAALLDLSRVAAKRGDAGTLKSAVADISARSSSWPPEVRQQLARVQAASAGTDLHGAATQTTFLRNVLMRVPEYRQSLSIIKAPAGEEAQPLIHFVRLESPVFKPAPADAALKFEAQPMADVGDRHWNWIGAIQLGSAGAPAVAEADGRELHLSTGATLPFPGGPSAIPPLPDGVLQVDFNYDFKTDLVLAGAAGVRLFRQDSPSAFTDVTAQTKLPKSVTNASYTGAWAVDIEADGDLDVVLGARAGIPLVLRNNGDGTFLPIHPFGGISGMRGFAWADFDGDGNPDAAIVDGSSRLHIFMNERQGQFRERALPAGWPPVKAIAVADANNDGVLDLIAVQADGAIIRISDRNEGESWETAEIARVPEGGDLAGDVRLRVADLDNNGAFDLIYSPVSLLSAKTSNRTLIWLGDALGKFVLLKEATSPLLVFDVADLRGNGRLDLVGLSPSGTPVTGINQTSTNYHWQVVRPHAVQAVGDQRINPFGVGGEIEIRSGLLVQKQPITGPQLHFGLGEQNQADAVRVVWPNGTVRAEFGVKADMEVVTEQRLKASCPFLFAYNGTQMEFVKDAVPWGSAIGLRINTLGSAQIAATGEWYKIGRDQLVPHDGYYDLRITAELWEVYYYDYLALLPVDHPVGTEIFVDERFVIPPLKLGITTVTTPHKIERAIDDTGRDVTDLVSALDGRAVTSFGRGQYQGITRDHYLEVDLGGDAPKSGPLYLIAQGSIHDTESSVNVAITQGTRWRAHGLSVEVPDGRGGWIIAQDNLGFPAGRKKTVLFNLTNIFRPGTPRRVRLRTNLEIYWDAIQWAQGAPDTPLKTVTLNPSVADLHYRGYSVMHMPGAARAPEVPDYNQIEGTKQRWRDLIGYYTRYGDVRELVNKIDDRYVIVNSGDELSLRFPEQPPPAAGWVRDFVVVGDGWIKDGDYNSTFSKTVLPLPYHAKNEYTTRPGRLEDEWVYQQHPQDWKTYHTRYVTTEVFKNALRDETGR